MVAAISSGEKENSVHHKLFHFRRFDALQLFHPAFCWLCLMALASVSCTSLHSGTSSGISAEQKPNPRIVFLMMRMTRDSLSGSSTVELAKKTVKEGLLKHQRSSWNPEREYLSIEVLEEGRQPFSFSMEHPLLKQVEYEKDKELVSKQIRLDKGEFFIRLQTHGAAAVVNLYEHSAKSARKKLFSLSI